MRIFTERLSLASHTIEVFCEINWLIKFPNFQSCCEKSTRCKDHRLHPTMQNSYAWFFHFTKVRTIDFVKRCFKISRSFFTTFEFHWNISSQQRCVWLNRLRSQFYLRKRSVFNFMMASNTFFQASTFFKRPLWGFLCKTLSSLEICCDFVLLICP